MAVVDASGGGSAFGQAFPARNGKPAGLERGRLTVHPKDLVALGADPFHDDAVAPEVGDESAADAGVLDEAHSSYVAPVGVRDGPLQVRVNGDARELGR